MCGDDKEVGALPASQDRAVVNGAGQAVSALRASVPSAWFVWPVLSDWGEVEVELLQREGAVFRCNAADFEYWHRQPRSDSCDDIVAFRIVGMAQVSDDDLHRLCADWQNRHNMIDEIATFGEIARLAQVIEARSGETRQGLDPKDESAVSREADAPTPLGEIRNHD